MCNPYSLTKGQDAIRQLARAMRDTTGNLPLLPGIYPDYSAPIVRTGADGVREPVMARWGMPTHAVDRRPHPARGRGRSRPRQPGCMICRTRWPASATATRRSRYRMGVAASHHGAARRNARDLPPRGVKPHDIYIPDLSLEAIRVKARDFR